MRTDNHDLIGFRYNNETYYYKKNYQEDIVGIYNSNYELICTYEYDSYGQVVSIKDVLGNLIEDENHIANINPYRYRSYYYDKETKLYYLNSRYYNPEWGRFINADGIIGTSESYLGYNLYAYCENNPIINVDSEGNIALALLGGLAALALLAVAATAPRVMSPVTGAITKRIETAHERKKTKEKEAAKEIEKSITKAKVPTSNKNSSETKIYRYNGTNPGNLVPKEKDKKSGLSFSIISKPNSLVTTIEQINATGVLYAIQDSKTHVSVYPIGGTMEDWIRQGKNSIWTGALIKVTKKWDVLQK